MPEWIVVLTGTVLVLFSAFCFGAAVWREIDTGAGSPHPEVRRVPPVVLIAVNLLLGLVSIAALVGIWFGQTHERGTRIRSVADYRSSTSTCNGAATLRMRSLG